MPFTQASLVVDTVGACLLAMQAGCGRLQQLQWCSTSGLMVRTQERQICGLGNGAFSKQCKPACRGWDLPSAVFADAIA